jgi:hypothetical protein
MLVTLNCTRYFGRSSWEKKNPTNL